MSERNKKLKVCDPCNFETALNAFIKRYEERHEEMVKQNKEDHKAIITQTTKTNGTVADLVKKDIEERTAIKIISIVVVPVFLYMIYRIIDILFAKIHLVA